MKTPSKTISVQYRQLEQDELIEGEDCHSTDGGETLDIL